MDPKLSGEGLSAFVEGARVEGIEPVICLPLDPKTPERVASLAASTLGKSAPPPRAWMFLPDQGVERPSWEVLNLHRRTYQALKSVLPGAWVLLDTAEAAQSGRWEAFADHAPETFEMVLAREDLRVRGTCDAGESWRIPLKSPSAPSRRASGVLSVWRRLSRSVSISGGLLPGPGKSWPA
jgi:hypothetical protein